MVIGVGVNDRVGLGERIIEEPVGARLHDSGVALNLSVLSVGPQAGNGSGDHPGKNADDGHYSQQLNQSETSLASHHIISRAPMSGHVATIVSIAPLGITLKGGSCDEKLANPKKYSGSEERLRRG